MHTQYKVRRVNAVLQHPDPDKHFMLANLDYSVVGNADVQILECKTAGEHGCQTLARWYPAVCTLSGTTSTGSDRKKAAHICVLICGHETRILKVTRSESVIQHIVNAERYFWDCVEKDIPPDADASESAAKAFYNCYIQHMCHFSVEDFSHDPHANQLF